MEATLKLERIGGFNGIAWCAEIVGHDPKFTYERAFLKGRNDYTNANSKNTRGVYTYYTLESSRVYEVLEPLSWSRSARYFCKVDEDSDIIEIEKSEVDEILNSKSMMSIEIEDSEAEA